MAELHGGVIEVEREVGRGSRFTVVLPWDPSSQSAEHFPAEAEEAALDTTGPLTPDLVHAKVLLAEDNEGNLEMLSTYLRIKGWEVLTARNGLEAISAAESGLPDVILMDVQMPEMDGLKATRRLRTTPALRLTPVIALTALAMPGDRERCLEAGMDDYLSKPLGLKELHRALTTWVRRNRAA